MPPKKPNREIAVRERVLREIREQAAIVTSHGVRERKKRLRKANTPAVEAIVSAIDACFKSGCEGTLDTWELLVKQHPEYARDPHIMQLIRQGLRRHNLKR